MLAGIITESQYKAKLEEEDSMGKIGKAYAAPGYEDEVKGNKTKLRRAIENDAFTAKFKKILFELYNDASQGLIFVSKNPEGNDAVYVDENGKYKYLLTGEWNNGLGEIPGINKRVLPKSKAVSPPNKLDFNNFYPILRAVLQSRLKGPGLLGDSNWVVVYHADGVGKFKFGGGGGKMIMIGYSGYIIELSKFSRDGNTEFGFPEELGNDIGWVSYDFRD
jgi:hypothetical protein